MKPNAFIKNGVNGNLKISNINIVDVLSGAIKQNVSIRVINGLIVEISGKAGKADGDKEVSDNLWIIPGLIDSHVHLFEIYNGKKKGTIEKNFEIAKNFALSNIREALSVGVTCVRDMGSYSAYNNRLRNIIEKEQLNIQFRIVSCGHHITKQGGHWSDRGIIWDPQKISLKHIVKRELDAGANFIKVMNDDPIFSLAELQEIATTCKEVGKKFSCHAFKRETINRAFNAGADTIEHAACYNNEFCDKVLKKDVAICPTLVAAIDSVQDMNEVLECICKDCTKDEITEWFEFLKKNLPRTFKSGVKVIAGTDAGTFPTNFKSLPREIIQYKNLGASSLQALQSATINAAEALDISDITGSIDVGKSADLVILGKNPMENFKEAIVDVKMVISRGYIIIDNLHNNE